MKLTSHFTKVVTEIPCLMAECVDGLVDDPENDDECAFCEGAGIVWETFPVGHPIVVRGMVEV